MGIRVSEGDALIMVDVQNDFCPGGSLAVPRGDEVVEPLNRAARKFRHVVATQDWHPPGHASFQESGGPWPPHCVQGTPGAELHPGLDRGPIEKLVRKGDDPAKDAYSGFDGTDLAEWLRSQGVKRVFVGGLATDYCVRATALDARKEGFEVVVLTDAVRAVDVNPGDGEKALEEMREAGAILTTTEEIE